MLDICILDDDQFDAQHVRSMVDAYMNQRKIEVHCIDVYHDATSLLTDHKRYDLLFLDIEVGKENGIEIAKKMKQYSPEMMIIVITSYLKYSIEGYKIQAARYLLKPVPANLLYSELDEVLSLYGHDDYLVIEQAMGIRRIARAQIYYIESAGRRSCVHMESEALDCKETIGHWKELLNTYFVECYKGVLVHVKWINRIEKDMLYLENGIGLPLARRREDAVHQQWLAYQGKSI